MQVCPVEVEWVDIVMPRLRGVDVKRLSGGATTQAAIADASAVAAGKRVLCVGNRTSSCSTRCPAGDATCGTGDVGLQQAPYNMLCVTAVAGSKAGVPRGKRYTDATVDAARARFLARKQAKLK